MISGNRCQKVQISTGISIDANPITMVEICALKNIRKHWLFAKTAMEIIQETVEQRVEMKNIVKKLRGLKIKFARD